MHAVVNSNWYSNISYQAFNIKNYKPIVYAITALAVGIFAIYASYHFCRQHWKKSVNPPAEKIKALQEIKKPDLAPILDSDSDLDSKAKNLKSPSNTDLDPNNDFDHEQDVPEETEATQKAEKIDLKDRDGHSINIYFSKCDPTAKLNRKDAHTLLITPYAWDSNAYPGNEY